MCDMEKAWLYLRKSKYNDIMDPEELREGLSLGVLQFIVVGFTVEVRNAYGRCFENQSHFNNSRSKVTVL